MDIERQAAEAPSALSGCSRRRPVRRGDLGIGVCCLQGLLTRFGLDPGEIHGVFGIRTASALLAFQSSAGIETDCLAGRETLSALCTQLS